MSKTPFSGEAEKQEVISGSDQLQKRKEKISKPISGKIRNALLLAGGLSVLGSASQGCEPTQVKKSGERIGSTSQALSSELKFNAPTKLPWSDGLSQFANVVRSGANIKVIFNSTRAGGAGGSDIWVVGSNDNGVTWTSPLPTPVGYSGLGTAINTAANEAAPIVFNAGTQIFIARSTKIQLCDWNNALNQAGNCLSVGANINQGGHGITPYAVDNGNLYYGDQNPVQNDFYSTPIGALPLAAGTPVASLNTGVNDDGLVFNGTYGILGTNGRAGNLGGYDMYAFDWNGATKTATNITNLNLIPGSYPNFNKATDQTVDYIDSIGDLWYEDNADIYWATKIVTPPVDAGSDSGGTTTDSGTPSDGAIATDGSTTNPDGGTTNPDGSTPNPADCTKLVQEKGQAIPDPKCLPEGVDTEVTAPATLQKNNTTINLSAAIEGPGKGTVRPDRNKVKIAQDLDYEIAEPTTENAKIISEEGIGLFAGLEGTKTGRKRFKPGIRAYSIYEGVQSFYTNIKQELNAAGFYTINPSQSTTIDFSVEGAKPEDKGRQFKGTWYYEESSGKFSNKPDNFNTLPPVEPPGEGCAKCSTTPDHNSNNPADVGGNAAIIALAVAAVMANARRQKGMRE